MKERKTDKIQKHENFNTYKNTSLSKRNIYLPTTQYHQSIAMKKDQMKRKDATKTFSKRKIQWQTKRCNLLEAKSAFL